MRVDMPVSEVLVKDIKHYKFTCGGIERSLVRHGTFGFFECCRLRELNSARFSTCYYHCSHANWHLDCKYSSVLVDMSLERCGRVPRRVRSWEPHVGQKALVPDPHMEAVTCERESEHVAVH